MTMKAISDAMACIEVSSFVAAPAERSHPRRARHRHQYNVAEYAYSIASEDSVTSTFGRNEEES